METLWFCLAAVMITVYVILDGFDLGAGAVHLFIARSNEERKAVLDSIGPFWDGNEVWLISAGGTLFLAFPVLYASSFQGFYLPLMMVLWLLMARGLSIELRNHLDAPMWLPLWDLGFSLSSLALAIVFGAALGNVVRGVPLDDAHEFFLPLWTDWKPGAQPGILDWYTLACGVTAAAALILHGTLWIVYKTAGSLHDRAKQLGTRLFIPVAILSAVLSLSTFRLQPHVLASFDERPWGWVLPLLALTGLAVAWHSLRAGKELAAFLGSCLYLAGLMGSAAFGLFPYVLPSCSNPASGLTITNAASSSYSQSVALYWWVPGMAIAVSYFVFVYRRFAGKVHVS